MGEPVLDSTRIEVGDLVWLKGYGPGRKRTILFGLVFGEKSVEEWGHWEDCWMVLSDVPWNYWSKFVATKVTRWSLYY